MSGPFLPIAAISRSQGIRIGDARSGIGSHVVGQIQDTINSVTPFPYYVDLGDGPSRRDLAHHSAIGAVIVVGNITNLSSDFGVTSGLGVTSGTGLTVNIASGVLGQYSSDGAASISVSAKTGLATPASATAATDITYLIVVTDLAGADQATIEAIPGEPAGTGTSVAPGLVANTVPLATVVVANGASNVGTITSVAPAVSSNSFTSLSTTGNADIGGTLGVDGTATFDGAVGFNGATPVGLSAAYTKTYSTAARTIPAATAAAVVTTGSTTTTPYGYTLAAQADAIPVAINALEADVLALKKLIVALVVDLEAVGIAG